MSLPAALDRLGADVVELRGERVEQRDRGRVRRLVLQYALVEFDEVEVDAAILLRPGALEDVLARDAERQSRRQCKRLLRPGEHEVELPLVRLYRGAGDPGNAVNEQN